MKKKGWSRKVYDPKNWKTPASIASRSLQGQREGMTLLHKAGRVCVVCVGWISHRRGRDGPSVGQDPKENRISPRVRDDREMVNESERNKTKKPQKDSNCGQGIPSWRSPLNQKEWR